MSALGVSLITETCLSYGLGSRLSWISVQGCILPVNILHFYSFKRSSGSDWKICKIWSDLDPESLAILSSGSERLRSVFSSHKKNYSTSERKRKGQCGTVEHMPVIRKIGTCRGMLER